MRKGQKRADCESDDDGCGMFGLVLAAEYHASAIIELWGRHENAKQSDKADNMAVNLLSR